MLSANKIVELISHPYSVEDAEVSQRIRGSCIHALAVLVDATAPLLGQRPNAVNSSLVLVALLVKTGVVKLDDNLVSKSEMEDVLSRAFGEKNSHPFNLN